MSKCRLALLFFSALLASSMSQLQAQSHGASSQNETVGIIRLSDMGTNDVLDMLEKFTGKSILRQQNLPTVKINFSSVGPMTEEEAILALESLLSLNGVAITELGEKFLKAVPAATIGTQVPRMIENSTLAATPSQKIYSKFFRLNYLTSAEAIPLIQPLLSLGAPVAFEKTNSLMITDALVNLQRVESILQKIDQPTKVDREVLFFQLEHIVASEMAQRLQAMQSGSLKRFLENNTFFEADDRTNQLIIFTHPSNTDLITSFIQNLDIDVAPLTQTEIFYLKHANATDVTTLIEQVVSGQQQTRSEDNSTRQNPPPSGESQAQQQASPPSSQAVVVADAATSNLQFSDYLKVIADPRGNSIVAYGTPTDLRHLYELIEKIDILLAQVRIEVVIAEVTLGKNQMRGIDSFSIDFNLMDSNEINFDVPGQGFNFQGSVKNFSIAAVLDTARSKNDVQVLSAPTIVTTHNQEATIIVAESRPIITATQTDVTGDAIRSNVQFRDIGIELTVNPLIGANGVIQMEINQTVENITGQVIIDGNEQPVIGRRQATSFISVGDGELIVLGGLQELEDRKSRSRLAYLGNIPVLGPLFGAKTTELRRRELLIFIRPKVITTTAASHQDAVEQIDKLSRTKEVKEYLEERTFNLKGQEATLEMEKEKKKWIKWRWQEEN